MHSRNSRWPRAKHTQELTESDGHPIAVDVVTFVNMLDDLEIRLTVQDFEETGNRNYRLETRSLEIPDHTWTLQTEGRLDLS